MSNCVRLLTDVRAMRKLESVACVLEYVVVDR